LPVHQELFFFNVIGFLNVIHHIRSCRTLAVITTLNVGNCTKWPCRH